MHVVFVKIAGMLNNTFLCAGLKRKRDDHGMEAVVAIIEGMEERAGEREERVRKKERNGGRGKEDEDGARGRREDEGA